MSEQLLPCPFCGARAEVRYHAVQCSRGSCTATWPLGYRPSIEEWNTRATPPTGEQAALEPHERDHYNAVCALLTSTERDRDSLQHSLDASRDLVNELTNERDTLRASLAACMRAMTVATEDGGEAWNDALAQARAASEGGRT